MPLIGAALAGAIASLGYAPMQWWVAVPASIAFLIALLSKDLKSASAQGLAYGLGFFLPLLHWSGTFVGALPWVALALVQAVFLAPVAPAISWARSRHGARVAVLVAPPIWVAMEAIRARFPWGGFGWGRVAFSQVDAPYATLAALGGAPLLSFVTVWVAAALAHRRLTYVLAVSVAIVALVLLADRTGPEVSSAAQSLKVAAVQGNVPRLGLDFNAQRMAVLNNHIAATQTLSGEVDLVVWPENASDIDPLDDPEVRARIDRLAESVDAPILVGAVLRDDGRLLNAALWWTPSGVTDRYVKRRLAPFGEYMPLRGIAERLVPEARRVVDFTAGDRATLFEVEGQSVGTLICFEVLYDDLARDLVHDGATLLVAQTNSATFGTSPESAQQLQMTRLRAIEHRRSIASAATSGISALIDPRGQVIAESEFFTQAVLTAELPLVQGRTVSDRIGGWAEAGLITLPIMMLPVLGQLRRRR